MVHFALILSIKWPFISVSFAKENAILCLVPLIHKFLSHRHKIAHPSYRISMFVFCFLPWMCVYLSKSVFFGCFIGGDVSSGEKTLEHILQHFASLYSMHTQRRSYYLSVVYLSAQNVLFSQTKHPSSHPTQYAFSPK